ncbi:MBL fold metallo-hydrolase [Chitinophaga sp. NPDC101104]|uniref:MBL fold metallo-hydrolase n=1 Tax=Chitinophaga sp. NPDC101104 TaxID=3390561 RepID=UPI003D0087FF
MKIRQFEDKALAHFSYAITGPEGTVLVDPGRDPLPYLEYAAAEGSNITGIIETHPHADFVSCHLELHKAMGATVYCSRILEATYPHTTFDNGDTISLGGGAVLKALNTPGHSPDSISIVLEENGQPTAVFTGDTLFIGDCGRPDLREKTGKVSAKREALAKDMYHSLRKQLMTLPDEVVIYPAHGSGSLCGKNLSSATSATIGEQKQTNWSLQEMSEAEFTEALLSEQPFIPKYFPYDVSINRKGAEDLETAIKKVPGCAQSNAVVIDTRPENIFKQGHIPGAINLQDGGKFETWLGSIVTPDEPYVLLAGDAASLDALIRRTAKIGYESFIAGTGIAQGGTAVTPALDVESFRAHPENYTIVDVRNASETAAGLLFPGAITIPLHQLRERTAEIPAGKPIVVHCAGGYRSAAGSSIVAAALPEAMVFDLGETVKTFQG